MDMFRRKKIVIVSERDKDIFNEFGIMVAGGLSALGIEDLLNNYWQTGMLKIGIAFILIIIISKFIRCKSDTK